jgi:hypothetical protein
MSDMDHPIASRTTVPAEQRTTARDVQAAIQFPVSGRLWCPERGIDVRVELLNYHYRGACVRLVDDEPTLFNDIEHQDIRFDFYLGQQCVKQGMPIRIAWKASTPSRMVGIAFLAEASAGVERAQRYPCHQDIAPLITSPDPLDANRHLYCKVIDMSQSGMLLSTSLTNKHLLPGMQLENAQLAVPGEPPVSLCLTIHNTREAPREGCFHLGVTVHTAAQGYERLVSRYLSTMSPSFVQDVQKGSKPGAHLMRGKHLKQGLTFRVVRSAADYREVLRLRHQGYGAKGKLRQDATVDSQGEGLAHEGTIIGAYLSGVLIASMELRFGDAQSSFRTFTIIPREQLPSVQLDTTVEVNRLVIHPAMQGTDVVIGMVQKAHALVMAHGGKDILFVATDLLLPLYRKIGCIELGARVPHPHLHGEYLNAMMLTRDTFLDGRFLNPATWEQLYRTTHEYFQKICGDTYANPSSDTLEVAWMSVSP